jgi:integrase
MANLRSNNGKLFLDFRFQGKRYREYTALEDTPENRKRLSKVRARIETEITAGTFDYANTFPGSRKGPSVLPQPAPASSGLASQSIPGTLTHSSMPCPTLKDFADTWFGQMSIEWRQSYKATVRQIIDSRLIPRFGDKAVSDIRRDDILNFRSDLAKVQGRKEGSTLSPRRINAILLVLRQILNEAADRFQFTTAAHRIKPLRLKKTDVQPFTLDEVTKILATVREDFRDYLTVRFFTGMRSGEIDGLKWKYIDFERRLILVRETIVHGREEYTKTDESQRDIRMSQIVFDALQRQAMGTRTISDYVFCTRNGEALDATNFCKRVWYPLLRHLNYTARRPYQTRHTAATLWLAAGENPQWIAMQLGHANTSMLFKVYARFVPNLTRQDGTAFDRLLLQSGMTTPSAPTGANDDVSPQHHPSSQPISQGAQS